MYKTLFILLFRILATVTASIYTVLCLYFIVLLCTVLYSTVLYYTVLYRTIYYILYCTVNCTPLFVLYCTALYRLLARVLKEGVQFWYNDTSTVMGGGGGGGGGWGECSKKRSSGKPLNFKLLHVSICSKLVRNFSKHLAL